MTRSSLGVLAALIAGMMVIVGTAGLDDLPRALRSSVASAPARLEADRVALEQNRQAVEKALQSDPAFLQNDANGFRSRLDSDRARLHEAAAALAAVQQVAKANRRSDTDKVERALQEFDTRRHQPVDDSAALKAEVDRAIYDKLHPFDRQSALAPVRKAMVDWPEKKADLESRMESVRDASTASALNALAAQLYTNWDKLLLRADRDRQKVRIVRTENGQTTTTERTEYRAAGIGDESEGMVIEHKPAGKYDSESERSVQPPGYAYIAPPGQSNRYGHWSDGVWHWLPAYLLLSQMLHVNRTPPVITTREYHNWTPGSQQSSSGWWKERPKNWEDRSFGSSKYKSRGSYGGSRYQSRGTFRSFSRGRR